METLNGKPELDDPEPPQPTLQAKLAYAMFTLVLLSGIMCNLFVIIKLSHEIVRSLLQ